MSSGYIEGDITGVGSEPDLTAICDDDSESSSNTIIFAGAQMAAMLADGSDIAHFTATNGVIAPLTVSTVAAEVYPGSRTRSVVKVQGDAGGGDTPDNVQTMIDLPEFFAGRWVRARYMIRAKQTGAVFGGAAQTLNIAMRIVGGTATVYPADQYSTGHEPAAPGAGQYTGWLEQQAVFWVEAAGTVDIRCFLTTRSAPCDDVGFIQSVRLDLLDGPA